MKQKSPKQKLFHVLAALLAAGMLCAAVPLLINLYVIQYAKPYIRTPETLEQTGADCVLVLGAKVESNGRPSHMLEDRLLFGIDLYERGAAPKLLVSGDHGRKHYDEVNAMKAFSIEKGVPAGAVFMDHAGFSTYESMYRARDVFQVESVVVVTQRYHLYRAVYTARKLGLDAYGVASDPRTYGNEAYHNTREFLARCKAFVMCIYKPKPTFLGNVIPISGDGSATDDRL